FCARVPGGDRGRCLERSSGWGDDVAVALPDLDSEAAHSIGCVRGCETVEDRYDPNATVACCACEGGELNLGDVGGAEHLLVDPEDGARAFGELGLDGVGCRLAEVEILDIAPRRHAVFPKCVGQLCSGLPLARVADERRHDATSSSSAGR